MPERGIKEALIDIEEAIRRIKIYTDKSSYDDFVQDLKTQDAVVRNFEIIGEAVKFLNQEFRDTHSEIPWKKIAGIRDRLIHHYFGVNFEIIWTIIQEELEFFEKEIKKIIKKL